MKWRLRSLYFFPYLYWCLLSIFEAQGDIGDLDNFNLDISQLRAVKGTGRNIFLIINGTRHHTSMEDLHEYGHNGSVFTLPDTDVISLPKGPPLHEYANKIKRRVVTDQSLGDSNHTVGLSTKLIPDSDEIVDLIIGKAPKALELIRMIESFEANENVLSSNDFISPDCSSDRRRLDAVIVTTHKDAPLLRKALYSCIRYLRDICHYYVISDSPEELKNSIGAVDPLFMSRVSFVSELLFPFTIDAVYETMAGAVKEHVSLFPKAKGENSAFEHFAIRKKGWYLQQLIKLYAGRVLNLTDYLVIDSDIIWYRPVKLRADSLTSEVATSDVDNPLTFKPTYLNPLTDSSEGESERSSLPRYFYAYSSEWNNNYHSTMKSILNISIKESKVSYRSGICHHIIFVKEVIEGMAKRAERYHFERSGPLGVQKSFWEICLIESARELICRSSNPSIHTECGKGSVLSEYDMYFHFAMQFYPQTVALRQLIWANGPGPGYLYWPSLSNLYSVSKRGENVELVWNWKFYGRMKYLQKHNLAFTLQRLSDSHKGYHFVAYHSYARRRFFAFTDVDLKGICEGTDCSQMGMSTTCSWKYYMSTHPSISTNAAAVENSSWWFPCICIMLRC